MSAQDYPHYEIEFKSPTLPADPNATPPQAAGARTLLGPHSFVLSPSKSRIQVTLAHHDDKDDFPNLTITFTDID